MYIPEKTEAMALFIKDMSYYGNKLFYFIFYPKLSKANHGKEV